MDACGVLKMALEFITHSQPIEMIDESLQLLSNLVMGNNVRTKNSLLKHLRSQKNNFDFLVILKQKMNDAIN